MCLLLHIPPNSSNYTIESTLYLLFICTHIRLLITAPNCDPRNSPIIIMSYLTLCREKLEIQPTRRLVCIVPTPSSCTLTVDPWIVFPIKTESDLRQPKTVEQINVFLRVLPHVHPLREAALPLPDGPVMLSLAWRGKSEPKRGVSFHRVIERYTGGIPQMLVLASTPSFLNLPLT